MNEISAQKRACFPSALCHVQIQEVCYLEEGPHQNLTRLAGTLISEDFHPLEL